VKHVPGALVAGNDLKERRALSNLRMTPGAPHPPTLQKIFAARVYRAAVCLSGRAVYARTGDGVSRQGVTWFAPL